MDVDIASGRYSRMMTELSTAFDIVTAFDSDDIVTAFDSDESDASIFGLRSASYEVEGNDELSEALSREDEEGAAAERYEVSVWRTDNLLLDDLDFAYAYVDFEEAYFHAGRAVAMAWSWARVLAKPETVTDRVKFSAVEPTVAKMHRADGQRRIAASKRRRMANAAPLRQPGGSAGSGMKEDDKEKFIEPLAQLMMDCRLGDVDEDAGSAIRHKATRAVEAAETPTLHGAVTTADEMKKHLESRARYMGLDEVEPMTVYHEPTVLEEFLWHAQTRGRAVNAVNWMCSHLEVGWPIGWVEKPDAREVFFMEEGKTPPVAQPSMLKALTDALETGAEAGDSTWLALLASWLQAMANLHLSQVLHKSVPVERYSGWMLFFCKQEKKEQCDSGFYWGAPSKTACGYDWAVRFLEIYGRRRQSSWGREMMGMIFRLDTFEHLSARAVKALTMNAVAGVVRDQRMSAICSWKRLLPTVAQYLGFSPAEHQSIGERGTAEERGNEATITWRYTEGRLGKSRVCKLICAAVLSKLASEDISTFEEVTEQQWKELANAARARVEANPMEVSAMWRNPDVMKLEASFKRKETQFTWPQSLDGVYQLAEYDEYRYCVDFQYGKCQGAWGSKGEQQCPFGLHRCPTVMKDGLTCHGKHSAFDCRFASKTAPQEGNPGGGLACRGEKPHCGGFNTLEHVEDDSIMRKLLPELQRERSVRRGNRLIPEPPRLVAKVCEEEGKGELWLGPLPTEQRMGKISMTKPSIQIFCFLKAPVKVQVEPGGEKGMFIPGTKAFRCAISTLEVGREDMQALLPCLVNSLRQGDNAYVHCVSGTARAPVAAAVMSAKLMGISYGEALSIVSQVRNVVFNKGEQCRQETWINEVLQVDVDRMAVPTGFFCRTPNLDGVVIHAATEVEGSTKPICLRKPGKQFYRHDSVIVRSIEEAADKLGDRFCDSCGGLLKASLRVQVERSFGSD